ncbi:TIGR02569 family protein [Candidatus Hydrogenedentota bacterium]
MNDRPGKKVLNAFNLAQEMESLTGGTGRSWRVGHAVLKPCDDAVAWRWMAKHLPTVKQDGFRLPLPLCANNGQWVIDGWCAQAALDGEHPTDGRWSDVLAVGDRFHKAITHIPRPAFLDDRDDPWALGERVAWEEMKAPVECHALRQMLDLRRPLTLARQIVHGDLTENVLFAEGLSPAIIDFSPYWRPVGFAAAVVVADAVCWRNADPETLLGHVSAIEEFPQLLVRALIFRMVTTITVSQCEPDLSGYAPGIDMVMRLIS